MAKLEAVPKKPATKTALKKPIASAAPIKPSEEPRFERLNVYVETETASAMREAIFNLRKERPAVRISASGLVQIAVQELLKLPMKDLAPKLRDSGARARRDAEKDP